MVAKFSARPTNHLFLFVGVGLLWVVCVGIEDPDIQHLPFMAISPKFFESLYSVYHERVMVFDFLGRCLVSVQHLLFYPLM